MAPSEYTMQQKKELVVKAAKLSLIVGQLYKMGPDEILRRYVPKHERAIIIAQAHSGVAGGHYAIKSNTQNILREGLWWPTLHKYVKEYYRA